MLWQHFTIQEHPIARILMFFREIVRDFICKSEERVQEYLKFQIPTERAQIQAIELAKILTILITDIRLFVELVHDAVVQFYKLDVKVAFEDTRSECLTNLVTSLVLKSPVYM